LRRARLESCARRQLPDLAYRHRQLRNGPVDIWRAHVEPNGYEPRLVTIEFERRAPKVPAVFADGPTTFPHRFSTRGRTHLCLWYPDDPPERVWVADQGLLALFGIAAHHLFKEGWWRETGEWLGEEAPHGEDITDPRTDAKGNARRR
jgi:hypothetical protein